MFLAMWLHTRIMITTIARSILISICPYRQILQKIKLVGPLKRISLSAILGILIYTHKCTDTYILTNVLPNRHVLGTRDSIIHMEWTCSRKKEKESAMTKPLLCKESHLSHDRSFRRALQVLTFSHHIQMNLSINEENNLIRLPP